MEKSDTTLEGQRPQSKKTISSNKEKVIKTKISFNLSKCLQFFMGTRAVITSNARPEILIQPVWQMTNENLPFYSPET